MYYVVNTSSANLSTKFEVFEMFKDIFTQKGPKGMLGQQIDVIPRTFVTPTNLYASLYDNKYSFELKSDDIFLPYKHPLHICEYEFDIPSLVFKYDSMHALHLQKYQNNKVIFLGFVIGCEGVKVVVEKVKTALGRPAPKSMRNVKSFHGIPRFYRHFVKKDSKFLNHYWRTMWGKLDFKLLLPTTYHPQMDGQTEITHMLTKINGVAYIFDIPQTYKGIQESNLRANSFKEMESIKDLGITKRGMTRGQGEHEETKESRR
ncbi:hypothetical protein CR513_05370, partial [Mucuna pruriens]